MRPGTPGFVGERLRQAREARLLSSISLAEMLGVGPSNITHYENGDYSPSPEVLERLASVLNVKTSYFVEPVYAWEGSAINWRSMASATADARRRGKRRFEWLLEVVSYLRSFLALPAVNFPALLDVTDPLTITDEQIQQSATSLRRFWGLGDGPISNVTLLLENNGVIVARGDLGSEKLEAFSQWLWHDRAPYIFLGAENYTAARVRFSLAHELAHLVLHSAVPPQFFGRVERHNVTEKQAHTFAGAFLLPAGPFRAELRAPTLDHMLSLKARWNVSVGMMIPRAEQLGIIDEDQAARLFANLNRRKWKRSEPLDASTAPEEPRLLKRCLQMLIESGVQTKTQVRSAFGFSQRDLEDLIGFPHGYLSDDQPDVRVLPFPHVRRPEPSPPPRAAGGSANVLRFPGPKP